MRILGLNVGSNASMANGRGWVDPETGAFVYLPIVEEGPLEGPAPTYRQLGFADVKHPDLPVHLDPEFGTFTYGHKRRFGDSRLWALQAGDILLFYATLDLLPERQKWGVYGIGVFVLESLVDTRGLSPGEIRRLPGFEANAHLKRLEPGVDLLIKGTPESRLYLEALPISHAQDVLRLHPGFSGRLATVSGKTIKGGKGWWRWLFYSDDLKLQELLRRHP